MTDSVIWGVLIINIKYNKKDNSLILWNNNILYSLNIDHIYFFEKFGRKIEIVLYDKRISFYGSFKLLELVLDNKIFIKCHKSYIINYSKIYLIDKDEIYFHNINSMALLSNNYKKKLLEWLQNN
jgi:DNA-binding LytR/AlgR family response regulator